MTPRAQTALIFTLALALATIAIVLALDHRPNVTFQLQPKQPASP